jgi:superfamily II DNA/RNA helicase
MPYLPQIHSLKRGVHILVATPGRLNDLLDKNHVDLSEVEITILDEADQMADMGFYPVARDILALTRKDGQRLLFSATLDGDVDALVKQFMKNPILHSLENEKSRAVEMKHYALIINQGEKNDVAAHIAARDGRTIIFTKTKFGADKLATHMLNVGIPVGVLHGGKTQKQRARVLQQFKDGVTTALIATDVAARGIHVDDVSLVVNYDAPQDHKDYLHRAGRTARAGATGVVVTLATAKQRRGVYGLTKRADVQISDIQVRPTSPELIELTGAQEPSGVPVVIQEEKSGGRGSRGGSREGGSRGGFRGGSRDGGSRGRSSDSPRRESRDGNFKKRREGGGRFESSEADSSAFVEKRKPRRESTPRFEEREERKPRRESAPRSRDEYSDRKPRTERTFKSDRYEKPTRGASSSRYEKPTRGKSERFEKSSRGERPARASRSVEYEERPKRVSRTGESYEKPARKERYEVSEKRSPRVPLEKRNSMNAAKKKRVAKKAAATRGPKKSTSASRGPKKSATMSRGPKKVTSAGRGKKTTSAHKTSR